MLPFRTCSGVLLLLSSLVLATDALLLRGAPPLPRIAASQPRRVAMTEGAEAAEGASSEEADGKRLITLASLDDGANQMIDDALALRNRERILSGLPKYETVEEMVQAYAEYEGKEQGLTQAQCEDAVLRFLQRRALMSEGADGLQDPQTLVTLVLLAGIVVGAAYQVSQGNVQLG